MPNRILLLSIIALSFLFSCSKDNTTTPITPTPIKSETVTIGTQVWMTDNLNVDHFRNGVAIPEIRKATSWAQLKDTSAWCYYDTSDAQGKIYGKLYNWYAVNDSNGLAPAGWHIPTDAEWDVLSTYLGGNEYSGGKLKETDTLHWKKPNEGATNSSGFYALPAGSRSEKGTFGNVKLYCYYWTSSEENATIAWYRQLYFDRSIVFRNYSFKNVAYSVRCIKD